MTWARMLEMTLRTADCSTISSIDMLVVLLLFASTL
jgi:hypothetical protein